MNYLSNIMIVFTFLCASCTKRQDTYSPKYKTLIEAVYASGNILPKEEYKVYAMVEGFMTKKWVKEGDIVAENQALFQIESNQIETRTHTSLELYAMAQRNYMDNSPILMELKMAIMNAQNKMYNDSINYFRFKNLLENEATSQSDYDKMALAYQTSKTEYILQKQRYEKTKNQLYVDLQNAQNQYQINTDEQGNHILRSHIKGMVYETYKEEGESVKRGEAIALVGAENQIYIRLRVDELDINKIKTGQEVLVKIDIYKSKLFKARITKIYKMLDKQDQSFRVDAEFTGEPPASLSGLTVEANIIIQQKQKALVIPKKILISEDSLWVLRNHKTTKIKIIKGIENYDDVEVLGGLDVKDILIFKN